MIKNCFILIFCICHSFLFGQSISQDSKKADLHTVLKEMEEAFSVKFSFKDSDVQNYAVVKPILNSNIQLMLSKLFDQTILEFNFIDDTHIAIVAQNLEGKKICGYLRDDNTDEVLGFALVSDIEKTKGVDADEFGYFEYSLQAGEREILSTFIGYEEKRISINRASLDGCKVYELKNRGLIFSPLTITEYLDDGITLSENANNVKMNPAQMSMLPGNVEADLMASLQFLPGISSPGENLDGLHVRGGTPDQNLILWDDIPVYHTSHLYGSITGFNPFIVKNVNVFRNGVSSRFGGRVSSVIDIESKSQRPSEFRLGLGFNLTQSHIELEAPVGKRSALFLSGRFSLTEVWNTPTFLSYAEKVFQGSKVDIEALNNIENSVSFNDVSAKWVYNAGYNVFTVSSLGSLNSILYTTDFPQFEAFSLDELNLKHGGFKLSWDREWNEKFSSEIVATNTEFKNEYGLSFRLNGNPSESPIALKTTNHLQESGFRMGLQWKMSPNKKFNFGIQTTTNDIDIAISNKNQMDSTGNQQIFENRLGAIYTDYSMTIPKLLQLDMGLRIQNSTVIKNTYFEPRINVTTQLTESLKLKLSTSKNFQFVSQLVIFDTNELGLANEIWVTANNTTIPVIESNQWTGGLFYVNDNWTVDVDAYVKEMAGITSLSDSFDPEIEVPYSTGTARITGVDVLLKRGFGNYKSWLSYTFSNAKYEFLSLSSTAFPATYDQKHIIQWVHLWKYKKWEFSAGLTAKSGLPFTKALVIENNSIVYDDLNGSRLPNYFRFDGSVVYQISKSQKMQSYLAFSFLNLWNQKNILSRQYVITDNGGSTPPEIIAIDRIGLGFTPNISANIRF